jgi:hypothetical protein
LIWLAGLFAVGAAFLDERRGSLCALPVQPFPTRASSSPETSGLAIDLGRESHWVAEDGARAAWRVDFETTVDLVGLSIDTGFDRKLGAKDFRIRLWDPDGESHTLFVLDATHERLFSCWHLYRLRRPFPTQAIDLRFDDRGGGSEHAWALRNVRFLVSSASQLPKPSLAAALREVWLPFVLGALWLLFVRRCSAPVPSA